VKRKWDWFPFYPSPVCLTKFQVPLLYSQPTMAWSRLHTFYCCDMMALLNNATTTKSSYRRRERPRKEQGKCWHIYKYLHVVKSSSWFFQAKVDEEEEEEHKPRRLLTKVIALLFSSLFFCSLLLGLSGSLSFLFSKLIYDTLYSLLYTHQCWRLLQLFLWHFHEFDSQSLVDTHIFLNSFKSNGWNKAPTPSWNSPFFIN
jgi:hypothetical protein